MNFRGRKSLFYHKLACISNQILIMLSESFYILIITYTEHTFMIVPAVSLATTFLILLLLIDLLCLVPGDVKELEREDEVEGREGRNWVIFCCL